MRIANSFVSAMTTNTTHFFRESQHFEMLGKVVLGDVTVLFQFKTAAAAPVKPPSRTSKGAIDTWTCSTASRTRRRPRVAPSVFSVVFSVLSVFSVVVSSSSEGSRGRSPSYPSPASPWCSATSRGRSPS